MSDFIEKFKTFFAETEDSKAKKLQRQASSHISTQIALLKAEILKKEDALETAKEQEQAALFNGGTPSVDGSDYCSKLIKAKSAVDEAQEAIEQIKASLEFFEAKLEELK